MAKTRKFYSGGVRNSRKLKVESEGWRTEIGFSVIKRQEDIARFRKNSKKKRDVDNLLMLI